MPTLPASGGHRGCLLGTAELTQRLPPLVPPYGVHFSVRAAVAPYEVLTKGDSSRVSG